jgi:succinate-semialdehyde dehydrogenase / glutarate-semialdehyde dehydrogenase
MNKLRSVNPATGGVTATYEPLSDTALKTRLAGAEAAFRTYRRTTVVERAELLMRAASILEAESRRWGELMTREMGKRVAAAESEAKKCAWACRYYAEHGGAFLEDEPVEAEAEESWVAYQPLGPILAVMPWNFPFWQLFRFAAPAVMAGNVVLLKHASNVPGCALAIEEIFRRAGFPDGVFQTLLIGSDMVEGVLTDSRVRAATLTGSEAAGAAVGGTAGRAIKKTVLELGGSDPFIVLPSADVERAIETAVEARHINNGQSCIAAKRFIIHEAVAERFIDGFVARTQALVVGDPMDGRTDVGPLATESIRDELADQVDRSLASGARLRAGGRAPDRPGWYYQPTVLTDLADGSPAMCEETFGPVSAIRVVGAIDEAIDVANATEFGLGASVWTGDAAEAERLVAEVEAGCVCVNRMVASDPRLPFGGIKQSGYGRELGRYGMLEFVNIKAVAMDGIPRGTPDPEPR